MYLQGNLQAVFDALFHMGVIDPVLEMDWTEALEEMLSHEKDFQAVVHAANVYQFDVNRLMSELERFDERCLAYLAMEVAKEFADFHGREGLH
ncbi:MAG: cytochrome [Bdellovibrionales bacterium]|nr:cytochrome [Bdellovibrionales bacterium]